MPRRPIVLVIDDEPRSVEALARVLDDAFDVVTAGNAAEAEALLEGETVQAILCDQRMPGETGVSFLKRVRDKWPHPVRMIISGYTDSEDIITGINDAGIYQYITKPWEPEDLIRIVKGAVQLYALQQENQSASVEMRLATQSLQNVVNQKKGELKKQFGFDRIVHAPDSPLVEVMTAAGRVAGYDISVLITGESGTGKELLARAIHYASGRADKPFITENCGALPDQLLESELFGYKKGAFTGAYEDRIGLFERANGGTIFLDEVGDTSPAFQVKLLRVLQEGEVRPLGAQRSRRVDVRVIAATNRDIKADVADEVFRQDLYYRLAGYSIAVPSLRDRASDIPVLAEKLLGQAMRSFSKPVEGFSDQALAALRRYPWPGNVRELDNEIRRVVALVDDGEHIGADLLSAHVRAGKAAGHKTNDTTGNLRDHVDRLEMDLITAALDRNGGNISHAAEDLGLSRVGLRGKMKRLGLRGGE